VASMETMHPQTQLETLHSRLRALRESRHLTLLEAAKLSEGGITAIALGSYERGDRSVSAQKLIAIANIYGVPVSVLFQEPSDYLPEIRMCFDLRKILTTTDASARKVTEVLRKVATMRGDWNGEVMSLRSQDITNLTIFAGLTVEQINQVKNGYEFPRSK
jgi:transcriptional regulator with XRE-family HTH domain